MWLEELTPVSAEVSEEVLRRCSKWQAKNNEIVQRQKWLGTYWAKEIDARSKPGLELRWISEAIGFGVFAREPIPPGTFIGEYTGYLRYRKSAKSNDYCFDYPLGEWFKSRFLIDAYEGGNHTRYINHSDTPNIETAAVLHYNLLHIILISTHPIPIDTELTYDYGDTYWKKRKKL